MGSAARPVVCIVTPGTKTANNGNWRTAARWATMLRETCRVIVQTRWDGAPADAMIALHATRSSDSVLRFRELTTTQRIAVVLTGTDLYRDLPGSLEATRSLDLADRVVALQDEAMRALSPRWRRKAEVIFQSARILRARHKAQDRLNCVAVGHLRREKDPLTLFRALERVPGDLPIQVRHIGAALEPALGAAARKLASRDPRYRYLGALSHGQARAAICGAHVLIHPSIVEGGANVIAEAICGATPVIASRVAGNMGMLGRNYSGYFEAGDESGLAACLVRALEDRRYLERLRRECARRRDFFDPATEARAVRRLVRALVA
jgi:putative glycosyltransferase (TIGR04348 family)